MTTEDPMAIVSQLQRLASTLPGMRQAPFKPVEQISEFPFAVGVLRKASPLWETDWLNVLATYAVQIHVARRDAPGDYLSAMRYGIAYPKLLFQNPTLGGLISTIIPDGVRVKFAILEFGGQPTLGWDFEVDVKMVVPLV